MRLVWRLFHLWLTLLIRVFLRIRSHTCTTIVFEVVFNPALVRIVQELQCLLPLPALLVCTNSALDLIISGSSLRCCFSSSSFSSFSHYPAIFHQGDVWIWLYSWITLDASYEVKTGTHENEQDQRKKLSHPSFLTYLGCIGHQHFRDIKT